MNGFHILFVFHHSRWSCSSLVIICQGYRYSNIVINQLLNNHLLRHIISHYSYTHCKEQDILNRHQWCKCFSSKPLNLHRLFLQTVCTLCLFHQHRYLSKLHLKSKHFMHLDKFCTPKSFSNRLPYITSYNLVCIGMLLFSFCIYYNQKALSMKLHHSWIKHSCLKPSISNHLFHCKY